MLLRDDIQDVLAHAEVLVDATNALSRERLIAQLRDGQYLIDLANLDRPVLKRPPELAVQL